MTAVLEALEEYRRRERLSQEAIAQSIGVTQGHYSKIISGKTPLNDSLALRIERWLSERAGTESDGDALARVSAIAESIRIQCMDIMHIAGQRMAGKVSGKADDGAS